MKDEPIRKAVKCPLCGSWGAATLDHIIPKWIYKRAQEFGFPKSLGKKNLQEVCEDCNGLKHGGIDVRHPLGRVFWTHIRDQINMALDPSSRGVIIKKTMTDKQ